MEELATDDFDGDPPRKKFSKKKCAVIGVISLIALVAVAVAIYFILNGDSDGNITIQGIHYVSTS